VDTETRKQIIMSEEVYYLDKGRDNSATTVLSAFEGCLITRTNRFASKSTEVAAQMFIKEYEKQIELIKRKGTRKQKLAYLMARKKNKEPIRKQICKIIDESIKI